MASNYDSVDLDWTWDGDLVTGDDGDLKDTSDDLLLSLVNEIHTVVKSSTQDWRDNPEVGADIDDFVGEPNDRITAKELQKRVFSSLLTIVRAEDLSVRVTPVHIHRVLIIVNVQAQATVNNKLTAFEPVVVHFIFDYAENGLYIPASGMDHFLEVRSDI